MKHQKKIFIAVIFILIIAVGIIPAINYFVDPFGAFSRDNFWYSYSMTRNPRTAKISYIDSHDGYDAYVVGSSGSSALVVESLNAATGENFYNSFFYGAYMPDIEKTIYYLVDKKQAKHIIFPISFSFVEPQKLNISMDRQLNIKVDKEDYVKYYVDFLFNDLRYSLEKIEKYRARSPFPEKTAVFIEETGNYDKRERDVESITNLVDYLEKYPEFKDERSPIEMEDMDEFFESLERVIDYCDDNDVKLDLVMYPIYEKSLHAYDEAQMNEFLARLSELSDYWDFTCTDISYEPRLFYDTKHYRNSVGDMMIAKMYGEKDKYIPDDFGTYVKKGETHKINVDKSNFDESSQQKLEVIILHSIVDDSSEKVGITEKKFEELLRYLKENGYKTVNSKQLLAYVNEGKALPKKPVVISFDDGYYNNYAKAFPLLEKYHAKAIFFPIGVSIGKEAYRHTDIEIEKHYGYTEIDEMLASGIIEIGSHTYDMHRVKDLEDGEDIIREDMLKHRFETLDKYTKDLDLDFKYFRGKWKRYKEIPLLAFAYPHGRHDEYTDIFVADNGFLITYVTDGGDNYLLKGFPQSLLALSRTLVDEGTDFASMFEKNEEVVEEKEENN